MQALAFQLDRVRASFLRTSLRVPALRRLYSVTPLRLFAGFLFFCCLYAPIALRRPDILLFFGPLVFGYPHLLASYRYLQPRERLFGLAPFLFFAIFTALSMLFHFALVRAEWIPELPFGAWELVAACFAAILVHRRPLILGGVGAFLLWKYSWHEPLVFAALVLLLHNWVAFFQWIRMSRGSGRIAACAASVIFGLIHLAVFGGYADFLMPLHKPEIVAASIFDTGAALAPWTEDFTVWYRAVVLYTFGLSLHYYVWLKALPECRLRAPLSWRRSFEMLARDFGRIGIAVAAALAIGGVGLWCFAPVFGARVYFQIATLHGWLELMFLLAGLGGRSWVHGFVGVRPFRAVSQVPIKT